VTAGILVRNYFVDSETGWCGHCSWTSGSVSRRNLGNCVWRLLQPNSCKSRVQYARLRVRIKA